MTKTRRNFLIAGFLTTSIVVMNSGKFFSTTSPKDTFDTLQNDLFPKAKELGVNVSAYLSLILHHSRITQEDKDYLRSGVKWVNETSIELYSKLYTELNTGQRETLLETINAEEWGENYLSTLLSYIMEAMFSDPIYGVNQNRAGQKWLGFKNGLPYPKEAYL